MANVSDKEVRDTLLWEFNGNRALARQYAERVVAVNGSPAVRQQYERVANMLKREHA